MVEKICSSLTEKIKLKMPEIDEERAEIINYGLQLLIGEVPKFFIELAVAWLCGVFELSIFTLIAIMPYKIVSGGVHLKTHIGCIISTTLFYTGSALLGKYIIIPMQIKYIFALLIWIFAMIMIYLYAPADTAEIPILRKKERKIKKYLSYIIMTITLIVALIIKNQIYSNILIITTFMQTLFISKFIYKIFKCRYGFLDEYKEDTIA